MWILQQQLSTFLLVLCLAVVSTSGFAPRNWNNKIRSSSIQEETQIRGNTVLDALKSTPKPQKKKLKTFQRYLEIECWKKSNLRDLEPVLRAVAESCKQINRIIQRAQTDDLFGAATDKFGDPLEENVQGEVQQQLDVLCNEFMLRAFCGGGNCIQMVVSEEEDEARCCSDVMADMAFAVGDYVAVFDPIDGSKNIDSSLPLGSIFAIYKNQPGSEVDTSSFYQDGSAMVAAGYCLFS